MERYTPAPSSPPSELTGARLARGNFEQTADRRLSFLTRAKRVNAVLRFQVAQKKKKKISGGSFQYLEELFSIHTVSQRPGSVTLTKEGHRCRKKTNCGESASGKRNRGLSVFGRSHPPAATERATFPELSAGEKWVRSPFTATSYAATLCSECLAKWQSAGIYLL